MNSPWIPAALVLSVLLGFSAWLLVRWLKRSRDEPLVLVVKWIVTVILAVAICYSIRFLSFMAPFFVVLCAVILSYMWTPNLASWLARPLTGIFDGGDIPPEPEPQYSVAQARRKRGHYQEALREARAQLERFPHDFTGQMLVAEIQAADLLDLQGAEATVHRLCHQKGHAPKNIAYAWSTLADWHLKYAQDVDSARVSLEQIQVMLPDTEESTMASQRLSHLGTKEHLAGMREPERIRMKQGVRNIGLQPADAVPLPHDKSPAEAAAEYVARLEKHPLDFEAREKLAVLYAGGFGRMDLAVSELEQLLAQPNHPHRLTVHWLNLLADLHVKIARDEAAAAAALQRILELFPGEAAAQRAQRRLDHLKLELKGNQQRDSLKLGDYEQRLGLKSPPPGYSG